MKKQTKIITVLVCLALLVTSAIGISVFAESTEPSISIESYNVSFSGELHLFYAVNDSLAAKTGTEITKTGVKLSLSSADVAGRAEYEATASTAQYKDTDYPTFYSFGIPAKNLDDVIYATPYAEYADGSTLLGEEVAYSVLEYCHEMILVDAPAAAKAGEISASKCKNMQAALRSLLSYGENTQKYLGHETENLPSDYVYVAAEGCTVNGSSLVFAHSSELSETLSFTRTGDVPAGKIFVGWNVTSLDGSTEEVAADGDTYETECASVKVSPIYYDDTKATTFETFDPNSANVVNTNNTTDSSFKFDAAASDPKNAANKCLKATVWANAYNNTTTANSTAVTNGDYVSGSTMDGNAFHFETDLYISSDMPNSTSTSAPTGTVLQITLLNGASKNVGSYTLSINNGNGTLAEPVVRIQQNFGSKTLLINAIGADGSGAIGFDEWFNVSFTLYVDADGTTGYLITISTADGRSYQYFDPQVATTYASNIGSDYAVKSAKISWVKTSTHRDVYLDNVVCETLEGETYAE